MCDICKNDFSQLEYKIEFSKGSMNVCPNCAVNLIFDNGLLNEIGDGNFTSEISGKSGAVKITDCGAEWFVTIDEMKRLFGHSLLPNEYKALLKNHSAEEFLIHDDFYLDSGIAWQPVDEREYLENLRNYARKIESYELMKYIDELEGDNDYEN